MSTLQTRDSSYVTWPDTLPRPNLDTYSETTLSSTVTVTTQNKMPLIRKSTTRQTKPVSLTFHMNKQQVFDFDDFYKNELSDGSKLFWFLDPITKNLRITGFDPSQEQNYDISYNGSTEYFTLTTNFIYWS